MLVAKLAGLSTEAQVADGGQLDVRDREAAGPLVLVLVHQVHGKLLVLEIGDFGASGEVGVAHAARRAACQLVGFAIVALVVLRLAVADHGHDVGEDHAGSVVLVRVEEYSETLKLVLHTEHGTFLRARLCYPECHAIAEQCAGAVNLELEFHLPVGRSERDTREEPAGFGGVGASETNVLVGADNGAAAEVEPAGLEVGVEVGLLGVD